ncbi:hypothetical protein LDENG_00245130 [Lucifuga dentata]|nr:hypothetical protein LDENG_00245130 [Lucifuga dentata]
MVRKKGSLILCGAFLFVAWNALLLLYLWGRPPIGRLGEGGGAEPGGKEEWGMARGKVGGVNLAGEVIRLAEEVEVQLETQKKLLKQIESHRAVWAWQRDVGKRDADGTKEEHQKETANETPETPVPLKNVEVDTKDQTEVEHAQGVVPTQAPPTEPEQKPGTEIKENLTENSKPGGSVASPEVIPILVIACDRVTVKRSLDRLIQYRSSPELHPIIVSQDCGHADTARIIGSYGDQVMHIRQPDLSDVRVRPEHRKFQGYYKIARHYRWALNQVFNTFSQSTVVIVEDDLEVSALLPVDNAAKSSNTTK